MTGINHGFNLSGRKVFIVSRCAMTLFTFRRHLLLDAQAQGATILGLGCSDKEYERRLAEEGIPFESIPVSMKGLDLISDFRLILSLVRIFRRDRPDIVHFFTIKAVIYGLIAALVAGVPLRFATTTGLGHPFTTGKRSLRLIVERLYQLTLPIATHLWFENSDDQSIFMNSGLLRKVSTSIIPGAGVDTQHFSPKALPYLQANPLTFLMISRLIVEKGIVEYVDAAIAVKKLHPDIRFLLLGGIDARNPSALNDEQMTTLRNCTAVEWIGPVTDVRTYIAMADVVVLPSYREGLPVAIMEAAAMGRALLATDVPGCREIVIHDENGYLVPAKDSMALANAMLRYINNLTTVARFGAAARFRVVSNFDRRIVNRIIFHKYCDKNI
jgi:glycosyltransferase involved in cell wall biosynthesis